MLLYFCLQEQRFQLQPQANARKLCRGLARLVYLDAFLSK
jgi:hypothetical protein